MAKKIVAYRRPVLVYIEAMVNEGLADTGEQLSDWVASAQNGQILYFEDESEARMVLRGNNSTEDLYEGWYLIKDRGKFRVLDPEEFNAQFQIKED